MKTRIVIYQMISKNWVRKGQTEIITNKEQLDEWKAAITLNHPSPEWRVKEEKV